MRRVGSHSNTHTLLLRFLRRHGVLWRLLSKPGLSKRRLLPGGRNVGGMGCVGRMVLDMRVWLTVTLANVHSSNVLQLWLPGSIDVIAVVDHYRRLLCLVGVVDMECHVWFTNKHAHVRHVLRLVGGLCWIVLPVVDNMLSGGWWLVGVVVRRMVRHLRQRDAHQHTHMQQPGSVVWRCSVLWGHVDDRVQLLSERV